jgi:hypothetical protein
VGASRGELAAWSKRVSGTRAKRRWSEARGVAAHEQKRTGVAACGCGTDALDVSGPNEQWRAGRIQVEHECAGDAGAEARGRARAGGVVVKCFCARCGNAVASILFMPR